MRIHVRPGGERFTGGGEGIESRYAFSFGEHYDPGNVRFGPLLAVNEELLAPGAGFDEHRHRDVEIVTWVVEGELEHRGDDGGTTLVRPGDLQVLSAGTGVFHSERNAPGAAAPVRFVQMWLEPDTFDRPPRYAHLARAVPPGVPLAVVASGSEHHPGEEGRGPSPLRQGAAALRVGTLAARRAVELPVAPLLYAHVVSGTVELAGERLAAGDAVAVSGATRALDAVAGTDALFLVWEMGG
jgi:quercetin 2,3-dioxygenase